MPAPLSKPLPTARAPDVLFQGLVVAIVLLLAALVISAVQLAIRPAQAAVVETQDALCGGKAVVSS